MCYFFGVNPNFFKISASVPLFDFSTGVCDLAASGPFFKKFFSTKRISFSSTMPSLLRSPSFTDTPFLP